MKIESLTSLTCYHIEKSQINLDVRYETEKLISMFLFHHLMFQSLYLSFWDERKLNFSVQINIIKSYRVFNYVIQCGSQLMLSAQ